MAVSRMSGLPRRVEGSQRVDLSFPIQDVNDLIKSMTLQDQDGGRIDAGKGCEELLEYFTSYKELGGDALLVLMGAKLMQLPEVPWVKFAGLLSERERLQALEAATMVVVPSPYESLSLLALEARKWIVRRRGAWTPAGAAAPDGGRAAG